MGDFSIWLLRQRAARKPWQPCTLYKNNNELSKKNPPGKGGEETWGAGCLAWRRQAIDVKANQALWLNHTVKRS
jgi:hypothetical protein